MRLYSFMLNKLLDNLKLNIFGWTLAINTVVYFSLTRIFQDWYYHLTGYDLRPEGLFESFGPLFFHAEPLEIYLYLASYFVITAVTMCMYFLLRNLKLPKINVRRKHIIILGIFLATVTGVLLLAKLPYYTLVDYVEEKGIKQALWLLFTKRIFVTYSILGLETLFLVWFLLYEKRHWTARWFASTYEVIIRRLEPLLFVLLIILLFHPNFPFDVHHYNYFLGSVNDVYQGKPLLYESSHLYGLLDIYFLLPVFKIIPLTYAAFSLIVTIFFIVFYLGLYVFIKQWLSSRVLALVGSGVAVAMGYFFQVSPTRSALYFPNMSPFRLGMYVITLFFILYFYKTKNSRFAHYAMFSSGVALYWNFDTGVFLSFSVLSTLAFHYLTTGRQWLKLLKACLYYFTYVAGIFAGISVVNFLYYNAWPNWALFFRETDEFVLGAGMYPLPAIGLYQILVLMYLTVMLVGIYSWWTKKNFDLVVFFLGVYGALSAVYYVGESTWQLLYVITTPFILLTLYFTRHYLDIKVFRLCFAGLIGIATLLFAFKVPVEFVNRDYSRIGSGLTDVSRGDQGLHDDAQYIKEHFPQMRIPLLHLDDTKLLMFSKKANYFDFYYMFTIYFQTDMQRYVNQVNEDRLPLLFIGNKRNDQINFFMSRLEDNYVVIKSLQTLAIYSRK